MDSYKTKQLFGASRPELQIGFGGLRKKDILKYLDEDKIHIPDADNLPKYQLVEILRAKILTGEITDIAETYKPGSLEALEEAREQAHAENLALHSRIDELERMIKAGAKPGPVPLAALNPIDEALAHSEEMEGIATDEITSASLPSGDSPAGLSPRGERVVQNMGWHEFRAYAKEKGIDTKGKKREAILAELEAL